jgi:hypothetical protein
MMFKAVFWVVLPCKLIVDNQFTRQYNPEDSSEHRLKVLKIRLRLGKCTVINLILKKVYIF